MSSSEHSHRISVQNLVCYDKPSEVTARWLLVAILQLSKRSPVAAADLFCPRLHVDVVHIASAVRKASDRKKKSRTQQVAKLQAGVVLTMTKGGKFQDSGVACRGHTKFLCKYRVRNGDVFYLVATVGYTKPVVIVLCKKMVEVGIEALNGRCVYRPSVERRIEPFHPYAGNYFDFVKPEQIDDLIKKSEHMTSLVARPARCIAAQINAFDFGENAVKMVGREIRETRKPSAFCA